MRTRLKATFAALLAGGALLAAVPSSVSAAPITCPSGQTAVHQDGTWFCQNNGGNGSGAGFHKGTGTKI